MDRETGAGETKRQMSPSLPLGLPSHFKIRETDSRQNFYTTATGRKKKLCPEKRERGRRRKANESSLSVDTGSRRTGLRDGPVDRGKRPTFTHRNFRRNQPARFSLSADAKKGESFGAGAGSARPLLWYESPGLSVSPVRWLQSSSRRAPPTATFSLRSFSSRTLGELVLSLHPSHWRPDLHDLLLLLSAWITRSIIMDRTSLWAILRNHTRRARGTWTLMSPKRITREGFE
ncbi:hypothetical protein PO909_001114 [Leuciscus waleckii]